METLTSPPPPLTLLLILTLTLTLTDATTIDCSSAFLKLADCLAYVSEGSTVVEPKASCCNGLKDVIKTGSDCLCDGFRNRDDLDVKINFTKAFGIPFACNLNTPKIHCPLAAASLAASPTLAPEMNVLPPPPPPLSSDSWNLMVTSSSMPDRFGTVAVSSISVITGVFGILVAVFFFCRM